ncbi:MAG: metal-dependent hydrolase [Chitinophagaceae bacterium]
MDTFTHIAIGACVGYATFGKTAGKKAMIWGAVAHSLPDVDFVSGLWLDGPAALLAHRGFTHSWLFVFMASFVLLFIFRMIHSQTPVSSRRLLFLLFTALSLHILLDSLNVYGTGWWEPFNHTRVAFDVLFVADPLFSVVPGIALLALLVMRKKKRLCMITSVAGLLFPLVYIMLAVFFQQVIRTDVKRILAKQGVKYKRFMTTPLPFQTLLHNAVIECESGYYIGYRSILDKQENLNLCFLLKREDLLSDAPNQVDVGLLKRFSGGYYIVDSLGGTVRFHDLRFGEVQGWTGLYQGTVFSYNLKKGPADKMVLQRGRSKDFSAPAMKSLWARMKGI